MNKLIVIIKSIFLFPFRIFSKTSPFTIIQDSKIDKKAAVCSGTKFYRSSLGKYSYIGRNCFVNNTSIGKFSSVGENCYIGGTSHPIHWVSTSSVFHKWKNVLRKNFTSHEFEIFENTEIGNDVWVGANVMVKSGVKISDGAVIGMGSIVTKDVGPYEIWAGNPARCIKKRFDKNKIEDLNKIEWWEWTDSKIQIKAKDFNDLDKFIKNNKVSD